ncbi:MAG: 4Fe-4S dicluster domain-containing protein [archaeon]|nr:4Fe-4S dicluster domain-containing protein [archaeon]
MSDEAYEELRDYLDKFPLGYPKTESRVEIKILKSLFSEEEAKITILISPIPDLSTRIIRRISKQLSIEEDEAQLKIQKMAKKGLIFRTIRDGKTFYNSIPFMIGLYEYSVSIIDKELAKLYKQYYDEAYLKEMGASDIPGFKVLPIQKNISSDLVIYPYLMLTDQIKKARVISVADCICRKESILNDIGCDYPMETCISFGVAAEYYINNGIGREITADEAIKIVEDTDKAGLIHAGANSKHLSNICNCCPCCCASMKGITHLGQDKHKFLNAIFKSVVDVELCIGCANCIDRCPVDSIKLDKNDIASIDIEMCIGCGLCSGVCSENAISIHLRENFEEPYNRVIEMASAMIKKKKKRKMTEKQ